MYYTAHFYLSNILTLQSVV